MKRRGVIARKRGFLPCSFIAHEDAGQGGESQPVTRWRGCQTAHEMGLHRTEPQAVGRIQARADGLFDIEREWDG